MRMAHPNDTFDDLFRYHRWANAEVFATCRGLDPRILDEDAPGTHGSIASTLKHLVGVEDVYLLMLEDQPLDARNSREAYLAHDLGWFADRSRQVSDGYLALVSRLDAAALASPLKVPWFDFALTKRDGLHQVLTHSAQHRAQVLSVLGARGHAVPSLDYVRMVAEQGAAR
jgi:uncharacterized damage-inducible protein DinB